MRSHPSRRSYRVGLDTGISAHVLEWSADRERTVILTHGFLDSAWSWAPMVESGLSEHFHVVAYDVRGHGDSDRVGAGGYYYFMDYVADLASLVDSIAHPRLSLVGHSMGGSVVGYYAGIYPDRVERLALLEGTGPPEDTSAAPDRVRTYIDGARARRGTVPRGYATLDEAARRIVTGDPLISPDLALELAERTTTLGDDGLYRFKHDPLHLTQGPYPFRLEVALSFWKRLTCPVMLVEGAESVFRHGGDELGPRETVFTGARREVIANAAHMMQRHQPEALAALLLDHLGGARERASP